MIVHIIYNDSKFVDNYISFFNTNFSDLEFYYVLYGRGKKGDIEKYRKNKNIIVINKLYSFRKMMKVKALMKKADKIIFSGIFGIEYFLYLIFNESIWNKTYLQFWGGDFYQFRDVSKNKMFMANAIKKCKCLLFGEQDYKVLSKIFNIEKDYKTVYAPCYNYDIEQYKPILSIKNDDGIVRIMLGNSASEENQHIDALTLLNKYKNENIMIYCPLSYGSKKYAEKVINYGRKIFGDKFYPLTEYVEYEKYLEVLSLCNIAIYNHNRQQAFGNIMISLASGTKVFLNKNNTLYYDYKKLGCNIYNIDDIRAEAYSDFIKYSKEEKKENYISISKLKNTACKTWSFLYSVNNEYGKLKHLT